MEDITKVCETTIWVVFLFVCYFFGLQDKHGAVTGDQESDSDSTEENVGDETQFDLTEALAQMANMTFSATTPGKLFSVSLQFFQRSNQFSITFFGYVDCTISLLLKMSFCLFSRKQVFCNPSSVSRQLLKS